MTRPPTVMELRCAEKALEVVRNKARFGKVTHPDCLDIVRAVLREARIPTPEMIRAMQGAIYKNGLGRMVQVTASLKHQMRWAEAIDAASPEIR